MPRRLADLLQEKLGTKATPFFNRLGVTNVGLTPTRIFANDANRFAWIFINLSANAIYLLTDPTVSASKGILAGANGGFLSALWEEDFELVSNEWWCVASGAASNLLAYEITSAGA